MSEACLLLGAEIDFHTIYGRLALSSVARADRFDRVVHKALQQLGDFPNSAPAFEEPFRRLVLKGFFLAFYYVVENQRVFVHAILDSRQPLTSIRLRLGLS